MGRTTSASLLNRLLKQTLQTTGRSPLPPPSSRDAHAAAAILSNADSGNVTEAISLLSTHDAPLPPSGYALLFRHCSSAAAFPSATAVLSHLLHFVHSPPTFLLNRAIETFSKCGRVDEARKLFNEMPIRDGGTWNAMIVAYSQMGCAEEVTLLFDDMNFFGIRGNHITFASVLGCCADLFALVLVRQIHGLLVRFGFSDSVILGSCLVDSYGKCLCIDEARVAFEEIPTPNAVSWHVIVRRYLEVGKPEDSVFMFFRMLKDVWPMSSTVSSALKACGIMSGLGEGKQIHGYSLKGGFEGDDGVGNSLTEMYAKCGLLDDARRLFDQNRSTNHNVVSWTSMISLYLSKGRIDSAEQLFGEMPERNVVSWNAMLAGYVMHSRWEDALEFILWMRRETEQIDRITVGMILNVCGALLDLQKGKQVHALSYRFGFFCSVGNAILDMYGKCGSLRAAENCFRQMGSTHRDQASWNCLIRCFARHKRSELALTAFHEMHKETIPDEYSFAAALAACANIFSLDCGKRIHCRIITTGYAPDSVLSAALIDMYSKCRCLEYAASVFQRVDSKDIIMWNSIILGCAYNGYGRDALDLFQEMETEPDSVTIYGILLACANEGLVDLGLRYFRSMSEKYGLMPLLEHYDCMIDLFGKNGFMDELNDFVHDMPFDPTVHMWTKIFQYCRERGYSSLAQESARKIDQSSPHCTVQFTGT